MFSVLNFVIVLTFGFYSSSQLVWGGGWTSCHFLHSYTNSYCVSLKTFKLTRITKET